MKKIECQVVRERKLVDLRAFYKISSKYDYFLVFLRFSSFCSHGYLQKKETWLPPFWLKLLPKLYGYSGQNSSIIQLEFGILGADGFDFWLLSNLILFWLFNFPPFFCLHLFVFFLHFPFFYFLLHRAMCHLSDLSCGGLTMYVKGKNSVMHQTVERSSPGSYL